MKWLIGISVLLMGNWIWARSLEDQMLRHLLKPMSAQRSGLSFSHYQQLLLQRRSCQLQLRQRQFPASCFVARDLELELNLLSQIQAQKLQTNLERACQRAFDDIRSTGRWRPIHWKAHWSGRCAQWWKQAQAWQRHSEEEWPRN